MHKLTIKDLNVEIEGKQILHDFNLEIKSGEIHAIMGPNGTGKSTLSKVIMGDNHYRILSGEIFFDELDDAIRTDDNIIKGLLHLSATICSLPVFGNENNTRIVMSGKTGYALKEWGWDADILLPGGLRKMTDAPLDFAKQVEAGKIYFFVDDSYFSGRTESVVKEIIGKTP